MGEYAEYQSERIKIGTCENMYYLRADQATKVQPLEGNVDPIADAPGIRFRFPFPDEDSREPGDFEPFRGLPVHVETLPEFDHSTVQFSAHAGYLLSIPCPESKEGQALPFTIHRNGFAGPAKIVFQRVWNGHLALVAQCGGCEAMYRLPEIEDAEPYVLACRQEADRLEHLASIDPRRPGRTTPREWDSSIAWWHTVADRIVVGYKNPPEWVAGRQGVVA